MRRGSHGSGSLGVGICGGINSPAALSASGVGGCMLPGSAMPLSAYPGSMGIGGYSKPPPAPPTSGFSHPPPARTKGSHIQTDFTCDRIISKDKYGPSLGGLSCSLPASREKSPNSGAGASMPDLHDCSMCLAAYIQSLNTVCGSASRLSQCLASLGSQSSSQHALKEACEGWEGLTRAVGVASAAVKAHMLALLQEATKLTSATEIEEEMGETTRKMHMEKLVSSLCSSFLSLQCQFSGAVLETFAPYSSMVLPLTPPSSIEYSPSLSSQFSTPATPPHFSAQLTPPPSANSNFTQSGGGTGASSYSNTAVSKMRSRTNSVNYLNPHGPGNHLSSDNGQNLQPPGFNTVTHGGGGGGGDSSFRRWSMGASGYSASNSNGNGGSGIGNSATSCGGPYDKLDSDHISGPGPPRRWSVPETTNDPPPSTGCSGGGSGNNMWGGGGWPWVTGVCNNPSLLAQRGGASNSILPSVNDGTGAIWQPGTCGLTPDIGNGGDTSRRLSVPVAATASSRESSAGGTRSNSHSRSATPDPGKSSSSLISLDELDELVDLVNNNHLKNFTPGAEGSCSSSARSRGDKDGSRAAAASSLSRTSSRSSKSSDLSGSGSAKQDAEGYAGRSEEAAPYNSSDAEAHTQPTNETHGDGSSRAGGGCGAVSNNCSSGSTSSTTTKSGGLTCKQHMHPHHRHCITRRDAKMGSKGDGNPSLSAALDPDVASSSRSKSLPVQTTAPSCTPNASTPAANTKKTMPASLVQGNATASIGKGPVRHAPLPHSSQQHQRHRSPFHQFPANNQQQQYQHLQQVQLQQYLYQQQLQANAYFKLSPISSSILKQQQYFPLLQQHIYQKQQQQLQLQQLQQLKLNQSLQFLHLQQQQQQQQRLHHQQQQQQQRKRSLQNLSTYYQELSNLGASLFNESAASVATAALEDPGGGGVSSSASGGGGSRRGSGNTGGGAGTATRTPVIHEATMENMDSLDAVGGPFSDRWDRGAPARTGLQCRGHDALTSAGAVDALLGSLQHKPSIPEVVTTSTPLWPPSGSVPGVTLTECTEEFKQPHALGSGWPLPDIGQDYGGGSESRDAPSRASWPSGHSLWGAGGLSLGGLIQDSATLLGGSEALGDNRSTSPSSQARQQQQLPFMRRHSDTSSFGPYQASYQQQQQSLLLQQQQPTTFSQQQQHPLGGMEGGLLSPQRHHYQTPHPLPPLSPGRNSRSSDNIHLVPDSDVGLSSCSDATLESLLTLNALLPNSSPPSPTARYTLFSPHT